MRAYVHRWLPWILIVGLLLPVGLAKTFVAPYDQGEALYQNQSGTNVGEAYVDLANGETQLFAKAAVTGSIDTVTRLGHSYVLNSGDLLTPFTATTTTSGDALGELNCVNLLGGTEASLTLSLQKWRLVGTDWVMEQSSLLDSWSCPLVTVVATPFGGSSAFSFEPGETYRLLVEAIGHANAVGGSEATVDFCASGTVNCNVAPKHVAVHQIIVPNQAPKARFYDTQVWYLDALSNGVTLTGRGCDVDGSVSSVTLSVVGWLGSTTTSVGGACGNGFHVFFPLVPGAYTGRTDAKDDEGAVGSAVGLVQVTLLPSSMATTLDLARPTSAASVDAILTLQGDIKAFRLVADGAVVADTMAGADAGSPGDHLARVDLDLAHALASVTLDGQERWAGAVAPAGDEWWQVVPQEP